MFEAPIRFIPQILEKPWGGGEQLRRLGVALEGTGPVGEVWLVSDLTASEVRELVARNRLEERLNSFTPSAGDAYVVSPGTIHTAGGGVLVLEVQETADVTYRLYDWGAVGFDGKPRELHVEKA